MHPSKRRCLQTVVEGSKSSSNQQSNSKSTFDAQVVDLTGPSHYDQPINGYRPSSSTTCTHPRLAMDPAEEASLQLARQLQAQEDALNHDAQGHRSFGLSSPTPALRYFQDDEVVARQLQAQFEAESLPSNQAPALSIWERPLGAQAGSSSALTTSIDADEQLAHKLDADFRAAAAQSSVPAQAEASNAALPAVGSSDLAALKRFAQRITAAKCSGCQRKHFTVELDVVRLFKKWGPGEGSRSLRTALLRRFHRADDQVGHPRSVLTCTRCGVVTCVGCGARISKDSHLQEGTAKGVTLGWCCDQGRLFLIWAILCGFDHQLSCESRRNDYVRHTYARPVRAQAGVGYGGNEFSFGHPAPYGGLPAPPNSPAKVSGSRPSSQAEVASGRIDGLTERVLVFLSVLLPTFEGESAFDASPPAEVLSMLLESAILDKVAELLRNDSVEDATRRRSLYDSALDFVRAVGSHHTTAEAAVHCERVVKLEGVNLLKLSFGTAATPKGKGKEKEEKTQSIASCLRNLNTQSNMMLQTAKKREEEWRGPDSQELLKLCQRVSELAEFLLANSRPVETSELDTDKSTPWERWQKEICLLELEDAQILASHSYAQEANSMQASAPGRMKRIILEITSLKTGLPAGIFVRHGASRLDLMKFMIVGPVGSPYEAGLFEFDLLCPPTYPHLPPKVTFRTTGGGKARFNPNLYNDGKVCLSLLGTWQGEPWKADTSTILQVLLSIQAMIFCDDPWCNEPGREGQSGTPQSKHYNQSIQAMTVRYAMLGWLQPGHNSIWKDIVKEHFTNNAVTILKKVKEWAAAPMAPSAYHVGTSSKAISPDEQYQLVTHLERLVTGEESSGQMEAYNAF